MLNYTVIMGRLTRDPELRRTGSGIAVTSFTVACDRDFGPKDGGEKQTDFIDCTAWRSTGEFVARYFKKGDMIVVSGRLEQRHWTDKETNKQRSTLEINVDSAYFGGSKKADNNTQQGYGAPEGGYGAPQGGGYAAPAGGGYAALQPNYGAPAPAGGGYNAPAPQGGYPAPAPTAGYAAPQPGYRGPVVPAQAPNYGQPVSNTQVPNYQPTAPGENYSMLEDDDAPLPF